MSIQSRVEAAIQRMLYPVVKLLMEYGVSESDFSRLTRIMYVKVAAENIEGAMDRLDKAKDLLREHGNYDWLTETGNFVVSNSGMEWAITYFVMLLALFFSGAGKLSLDHLIAKKLQN